MKRANGTGSVVKLAGKRRRPYMVRVSGRDSHGHVVQYVLSYHARVDEAQAALEDYNRNKAAGSAPVIGAVNMTLQDVYDGWSAREFRGLKPASIASHKAAWNQRVSRYARLKMRSITLDQWQAILDEDEDEGRSQSLINNDAILIKALCSYAMMRDIIGKDYSAYLDIPSVGVKRPRSALSDLQVSHLEQMARAGTPWADTALILCYTGFRISELLGLTPDNYHPEEGGYLQGGVKTASGKDRRIPIHPKIRPYVTAWLAQKGKALICEPDGSPVDTVRYREQYFAAVMAEIGADAATPHWCRHTFATLLHAGKADPLAVKWLLGHSTKADITAHYTHETMAALWDAINCLP